MQTWISYFDQLDQAHLDNCFAIAITPRSGSTYLGDVLKRSECVGKVEEYFNREAAQWTLRLSGARSLPEYFNYLLRVHHTNGVFGFEIDWLRLKQLLDEGYDQIVERIPNWIYLRRTDIISQAVSLEKARQSGHWHSHQETDSSLSIAYDGEAIRNSVLMLMNSEYFLNQFFSRIGVKPLELWYEEVVNLQPDELVSLILDHLKIEITEEMHIRIAQIAPRFRKIGDSLNESYVARFRMEYAELAQACLDERGHVPAAALASRF